MARKFYTERDIEDLARQGIKSLVVDEKSTLTALAREKANRLGVSLVMGSAKDQVSRNSSQITAQPAQGQALPQQVHIASPAANAVKPAQPANVGDLHKRIRDAVQARLSGRIDPALLDVIITRVLNSTGVK